MWGIIYRIISLFILITNGITTCVGCIGECGCVSGVGVWRIIHLIISVLNLITNGITTSVGVCGVCESVRGVWVDVGLFTVSYLYLT